MNRLTEAAQNMNPPQGIKGRPVSSVGKQVTPTMKLASGVI